MAQGVAGEFREAPLHACPATVATATGTQNELGGVKRRPRLRGLTSSLQCCAGKEIGKLPRSLICASRHGR